MKPRDSRGTLESVLWAFLSMPVVVLLAATGCGNPFGGTEEFVVQIDSITGPASVSSTETLTVRFWGFLGPNLCSVLDHVDRNRTPNALELTFHGEHRGGTCFHQPAILEHQEEIAPPFGDPFTVRVSQPDGAVLEKVVRVR